MLSHDCLGLVTTAVLAPGIRAIPSSSVGLTCPMAEVHDRFSLVREAPPLRLAPETGAARRSCHAKQLACVCTVADGLHRLSARR